MELSRLNLEYSRKSNEINRRKDEVNRYKYQRLLSIRMEAAAKKDEIRTTIDVLRNERMQYGKDSVLYEGKTEAIRSNEQRIARLKEQVEIEIATVQTDAYATRLQFDEEARCLSEWLEAEKLRLMESYEQDHRD